MRTVNQNGFSLVEVTLAVAIVAIGLLGIMSLFPIGMDATRQAADYTQEGSIASDIIAYYQQLAIDTNDYSTLPSEVIPPSLSISTNLLSDGIWYHLDATVINSGFSIISNSGSNMTSRVIIGIFRVIDGVSTTSIAQTNYFFTEVDRYVQ